MVDMQFGDIQITTMLLTSFEKNIPFTLFDFLKSGLDTKTNLEYCNVTVVCELRRYTNIQQMINTY